MQVGNAGAASAGARASGAANILPFVSRSSLKSSSSRAAGPPGGDDRRTAIRTYPPQDGLREVPATLK